MGNIFKKAGNWVKDHAVTIATGGMWGKDSLNETLLKKMGAGGGGGEDSTPGLGASQEDINFFREKSRKRAEELRALGGEAGGYDPATASRYYTEAAQPIEGSYFDASQGMARRGSSAGVPVGAQMAGQAALSGEKMGALSQARLKAIRGATQEKSDIYSARRQALLDQLAAEGAVLDPQMALLRAEMAAKQAKDAKNAAMWGGIGQLAGAGLGFAMGGPAGAGVGGMAGGSLAAGMDPAQWEWFGMD